ncbi:MAG: hypothetical protein JEY99_05015 [Spirochaetales bacterium]|nr:hypothetical protein [Spirochaetales bacterium]
MTLDQLSLEEQKVLSYVKSGAAFFLLHFLAEEDPVVRRIIQNKSFGLGISVAGGCRRAIRICDNSITLIENSVGKTGVVFRFPASSQLNNLLSGRKAKMLPLIKSFSAGRIIDDFKGIMARLPVYLNPDEETLSRDFKFITKLLMNAALRGIKEVAENDGGVAVRVARIPDGIISIRVETEPDLETLVIKKGRFFNIVAGPNGNKPNAVLTFKDVNTAYRLFSGKLNAVVALGTSDVKIRGRIPMIQGLFPILDRVSYYMSVKQE